MCLPCSDQKLRKDRGCRMELDGRQRVLNPIMRNPAGGHIPCSTQTVKEASRHAQRSPRSVIADRKDNTTYFLKFQGSNNVTRTVDTCSISGLIQLVKGFTHA